MAQDIDGLGLLDREKAAFKNNDDDGGIDKRVTDTKVLSKLDELISAIENLEGISVIDGGDA